MEMKKLPKAPLQEVIFEIRWTLAVDPNNNQEYDAGFELAQGKLQNLIKNTFPHHVKKVPLEFNGHNIFNYVVVHQFWKEKGVWPVVQLGPGIFSVNDTEKNYIWEDSFFPLIKSAIENLFVAYENKVNISYCNLRYIDAIKLNQYLNNGNVDALKFIKENLRVELLNHFDTRGKQNNFNINQSFRLEDGSDLSILVANGTDKKTQEPTLIWQTGVTKKDAFKKEEIPQWCEYARSIISPLFKEMTKGKLYDSFK